MNPRWLDVVLGGAVGGWFFWRVCLILSTGRYVYRRFSGTHRIFAERDPFWYWTFVAIYGGIALFCLYRAVRGLCEIIQVRRMDKEIESREAGSDGGDSLDADVPHVIVEKSYDIKVVADDGVEQQYHSLDEVPLEMRAEIEELEKAVAKEKGKEPVRRTWKTEDAVGSETVIRKEATVYKIVDESGEERTYRSLNEMPPELRAAIEEETKGEERRRRLEGNG